MGLFSWFTRSKPADYETVLAQLASDINDAKQHLSEIRLRERRLRLALNAYGVGLWAIWFGLWYFHGIPWSLVHWDNEGTEARVVGGAVVGGFPVVLVLLNRLISWIFSRKRTSEQTHLRLLLKKQREQVEEIKKATNFDSTRKLIEQYEDFGTPQRRGAPGMGQPMTPVRGTPGTPTPNRGGRSAQSTPAGPGPAGTPHNTPSTPEGAAGAPGTPHAPGHFGAGSPGTPVPVPPGLTPEQAAVFQMQMQAITPVLPTPEKKWYDRLADTILGDDPVQSAQNKYALVCGECFRHNGLIGSKHEWERMQWICPRCNHMNPSPLSRMQAEGEGAAASGGNGGGAAAPSTPVMTQTAPETPTKASKTTARASPTASPLRRAVGERATRSSRLGKEVFSAADAQGGEVDEEGGDDKGDDAMEVDK